MSQQAIEKIKEAESQAAVLCRVAQQRADQMRENVRSQGEAYLVDVEESTTEEFTAELSDIRRRALALEEHKRREAKKEADELIAKARERMAEAAHLIVWEIVENVSL